MKINKIILSNAISNPVSPYIVQYASRLLLGDHAYNYNPCKWEYTIKPVEKAQLLLLCGDIGYRQSLHTNEFIHYCSRNWENVIWIEGNIERKINPDGMPPLQELPCNVQYVQESTLFHLKDSHQPTIRSSLSSLSSLPSKLPLYLYATPLRSHLDLMYLKKEYKKEYKKGLSNYLMIATYSPMPYYVEYYPNNIVEWIQGYASSNTDYGVSVNMQFSFETDNINRRTFDSCYSPMKTISI